MSWMIRMISMGGMSLFPTSDLRHPTSGFSDLRPPTSALFCGFVCGQKSLQLTREVPMAKATDVSIQIEDSLTNDAEEIPNETTQRAMEEEDLKTFTSLEELYKDLGVR
jgi:F420-0:gamma-glutamyl ligase-like protein